MFPILSVTLFAPLAGALLILVVPHDDVKTIRRVGTTFAFLTLILTTIIWANVAQSGAGGMQFEENYPWVKPLDVQFHLGVDGLSAPLLSLTALLTTLVTFYSSYAIDERVKDYYILFLLLEMGAFGVFLALDLVLFYVFWELGLVPMFLLMGVWGGKRRLYASIKFFLYMLLGSGAMLLAIIGVYFQTGTFDILEAATAQPFTGNFTWAAIAFWAFFIAFAIRVPAFPFHTWLPDAHTEAPTSGSVILAGVLLNLGAYGLMRIALPFFPAQFKYFVVNVPIIPVMAVMSIAYGAMVCVAQWDLKRLVAYSSVARMGYVTLGLCAAAAGIGALDDPVNLRAASSGLSGAALQMFAQGIVTGGMFFLVGMLYERTHTRDLKGFGGLSEQMPYYYGMVLVTGLASLGLPGLAGFWSQFFVFQGVVHFIPAAAFISVIGVIFIAAAILKLVQHLFLGELDEKKWCELTDMTWWEKVTVWPLVIIMVFLGFYPAPLLNMFNAALTEILRALM